MPCSGRGGNAETYLPSVRDEGGLLTGGHDGYGLMYLGCPRLGAPP